jgi:hypothetical protein
MVTFPNDNEEGLSSKGGRQQKATALASPCASAMHPKRPRRRPSARSAFAKASGYASGLQACAPAGSPSRNSMVSAPVRRVRLISASSRPRSRPATNSVSSQLTRTHHAPMIRPNPSPTTDRHACGPANAKLGHFMKAPGSSSGQSRKNETSKKKSGRESQASANAVRPAQTTPTRLELVHP